MINDLDAGHSGLKTFALAKVAINQGYAEPFQPFDARFTAYQAADFIAPGDERRCEMPTYESASAGHQYFCQDTRVCSNVRTRSNWSVLAGSVSRDLSHNRILETRTRRL